MTQENGETDEAVHTVASVDELEDGERIIVEIEGREIGVFKVDDEYYAYLNWCVHQGGPLCEGSLTGRVEASYDRTSLQTEIEWTAEKETLICPWHDWEYDVRSGECLSSRGYELPSYPVDVDDGEINVHIT